LWRESVKRTVAKVTKAATQLRRPTNRQPGPLQPAAAKPSAGKTAKKENQSLSTMPTAMRTAHRVIARPTI
jgi:hypothetical protein